MIPNKPSALALKKLSENLQCELEALKSNHQGQLASYIPELAKANPDHFAIAVTFVNGETISAGDSSVQFSLQSTSKPFSYGLALQQFGREEVLKKVGVEPTGEAFNSIIELEKDSHRPFNPMINSGAIAICSFLNKVGIQNPLASMQNLLKDMTGDQIDVHEATFNSEKSTAHRNKAIAHLLKHFGIIDEPIESTLDLYFQHCSMNVNVEQLSKMAAVLGNYGTHPLTQKAIFSEQVSRDIISLMFTCGMYDTSGEWVYNVGIPSKSGVSGCIFGVIPGVLGVAVYSPKINKHGHSERGLKFFENLSRSYGLDIFAKGEA